MTVAELHNKAQEAGIPILPAPIPGTGSMCVQVDARCYIGIDSCVMRDSADYRVHLAHELGHCMTGSFYNRYAARDVRQKHENRADKWAICAVIPREELEAAVAAGHTEVWDLAEVFNVTEELIRKAMCWYEHGNLDTEVYFP